MGRHLDPEILSAFADGELTDAEQASASAHLSECLTCRTCLAEFRSFDADLQLAPVVGCQEALPLLSARVDGEVSAAEFAVAERHLAACGACRATASEWRAIPTLLAGLPSGAPSARVDEAVGGLGRPRGRAVPRPGLAARGLAAATVAVALLLTTLGRGVAPVAPPVADSGDRVLVAAAQHIALSARTNTLYVLDPAAAAVDARDATTNDLKARISVGGQPTAIALNESASTLLVLDASQKKLTEIDTTSNRVVGSSTVAVSGTPTAIGVDSSGSKIVVASDGQAKTSSSVTVIDGATKKVEAVRDFDAAPRAMVFSATGGRAAVVSADATTLLDASYKPVATLPGGVGAAFAQDNDDRVAVLSASGDGSVVTYSGRGAPAALRLEGKPHSIVALPDGGFLVLVDIGERSRLNHVAPDGHVAGSVDIDGKGRGLVYDPTSRRFSVAAGGQVLWAEVPRAMVAAPSPSANVAASPSATTAPTAAPSAEPSASPTPAPSASASPPSTASPTPRPIDLAPAVAKNFVHLDLPGGRAPFAVSKSGELLWVLDDENVIDVVDLSSGEVLTFMNLPPRARIGHFAVGRDRIYALDTQNGDLHVLSISKGRGATHHLELLKPASGVAVGLDDRLWVSIAGSSYLLRFDPQSGRTESFDLAGAQVSRLASDTHGTIYYADSARHAVGSLDPATGRISEIAFPWSGVTTALTVDGSGTIWLGTSAGEIWAVSGGTAKLTVGLQRPVTALVLDASGRAWYLAPLPSGNVGFGYATADGTHGGQSVAGPAFSLSFSALGRAWLADPRGGFWVSTGGR